MYGNELNFSDLKGKTITLIKGGVGDEEIYFKTNDGNTYKMYHRQDCCEGVWVEDIVGDMNDLIGEPLLIADESTHVDENPDGVGVPERQDSFMWIFYRLGTINGDVTIRWYGESNGYYSESVELVRC